MPEITAPYRFVPLSNLIVYPNWSDKVSHDKPFRDGTSGEMTIELENQTPLCVGGRQTASSIQEAGKVHFYRTPENEIAIPGTSLKGMLRNVLEIASFSPMQQVEDQKLGVRDLTDSKNFYMSNISNPQSGWLTFDDQQGWIIRPCSYYRVHQEQIIKTFKLTLGEWVSSSTAMERYNKVGICPEINCEFSEEKNGKKVVDISLSGNLNGVLVMTGQPGASFDKKGAKKYEFVFYNSSDKVKKVSSSVMSGFRQIHQDTKEWQFWQEKLNNLKYGIPVFYHADRDLVQSLGLAMMYKLPYKNSIHDAISHTNLAHIQSSKKLGMADLIFGHLDEEAGENSLRGRVQVGFAFLQDRTPLLQFSPEVVLSSPKATYYPAYIYQDGGGNGFNQLMQNNVKIAGWKRYQAKEPETYPKLELKVQQNKKVQVKLETLANQSRFQFKIRWHNLRPAELGALLWSLDFSSCDECCHALGMGKPFGLGQVKLTIKNSRLIRNDGGTIEDTSAWLAACRLDFQNYMDDAFKANHIKSTTWEDCDVIKALREFATPTQDLDGYQYLSAPKDYVTLKKRMYLDEFANSFHKYHPVDVENPTQLQTVDYQSDITQRLQEVEERKIQQEVAEARKEAKQNASEEEKALYDIEDFISKAEIELTNTMKEDAHKILKNVYDSYQDTFDEEQVEKLKLLANKLSNVIGSKKQLDKIVKKINQWDESKC